MSYKVFSDNFPKQVIGTSEGMAKGQSVKAFSDGYKTIEKLVEMFSRQEELDKMRSLKGSQHTAGQWVDPKSKTEVLAGCERDVRNRYHSRISSYLGGIDQPYLTKFAIQTHLSDMKTVSS